MTLSEGQKPVLVEGIRTPMGKHGGVLSAVRPDDMMAHLIEEMTDRYSFPPNEIDDVIIGCNNQSGEDSRNIARISSIISGLPFDVPGQVVNRQCGSSMETIVNAGLRIQTGNGDLYLSGGVESMSRGPYVMMKPERGYSLGNRNMEDSVIGFRFKNPKIDEIYDPLSLGETAEELGEEYDISREEQDRFSLRSHENAIAAHREGKLTNELVPIEVPGGGGDGSVVDQDEGPRADTSMEKLSELPPVFREGGTVTAGSASPLSDGAALTLMMSKETADAYGLTPQFRLVSYGLVGVHPNRMGIGPVGATREALDKADMVLEDIGLVELNEAFAAQSLAVLEELDVPVSRVNPNGGAIALGHPLGCSGARIVTTLIHEMKREGVELGLATMCIGMGQGIATIWEQL